MEEWLETFLAAAGDKPALVHFLVMGGAALLEYVVPPVPGDLVVLLGAVLVGAKGWSAVGVVTAVNVGSAAGMTIDYLFGRWVARHDARWRERFPRWRKFGVAVDRVKLSFQRWGAVYLVVNRFLPGIRAAFFVAAGMSTLPYWKVLLWGVVSAFAWNLLIFGVGHTLGGNLESLKHFFGTYSTVAWTVVATVVLVVGYRLVRAVKRESDTSP